MPDINPSWQRWTYASIADHLHTQATAGGWTLAVELLDDLVRSTAAWESAATRVEANISGPIITPINPFQFLALVSVFVVVTSKRSSNDYDHLDVVGKVQNALNICIPVKDYGDTGLLDVGTLKPDRGSSITPDHLRPAETDDQIFTTIEATLSGIYS